jgi:hypothetical protein
MQKSIGNTLVSVMAWGLPALVMAHSGHGRDGGSFSLLHYLGEPLHPVIGAILLGAVAISLYRLKRNSGSRSHVRGD